MWTPKRRSPEARTSPSSVSGGQFFEASATVIYAQPTLGRGVAFREVKPTNLAVLQKWLRKALHQQNAPPPSIDDFESEKETEL
jgi:myo-inositol-1-phosphate synthase